MQMQITENTEITGDPYMYKIIFRANDTEGAGWEKMVLAHEIEGEGALINVSSVTEGKVSEALVFVPNVKIVEGINGGNKLVSVDTPDTPAE